MLEPRAEEDEAEPDTADADPLSSFLVCVPTVGATLGDAEPPPCPLKSPRRTHRRRPADDSEPLPHVAAREEPLWETPLLRAMVPAGVLRLWLVRRVVVVAGRR